MKKLELDCPFENAIWIRETVQTLNSQQIPTVVTTIKVVNMPQSTLVRDFSRISHSNIMQIQIFSNNILEHNKRNKPYVTIYSKRNFL